ncbi:MAG: arsenate reductase [Bdellovibrionales bacterium RIFOXYD12_FULL_39_22]|nr:MAG: arsenate reductase [Bdellovibrionales bacterium RIFOXYB1_FULL_39_21]OFZ41436.1 MAG: arsenate reductase [Bdellovibrionales bacterium RIFOXYC12_FULL_39_17]OFZ45390.1 MAG: arsenate reductase [Bdellovibrionales bacterium RIFOXYC1_FULL_39_130]OFZ71236.1 MAG: arsenate reductase [Bdellovibrionales bacterium RIFOXYC2_FULL_39_8]OFZ74586.1 MAG: arsenate reductase [Bdellovibrionales bacterium RIFOXYD1_FULL_39_84]OFZ92596.1 MAG: arsenate reductase [Bdellovibrionales bacterium RIFOXYD12_FULL_39_22]
MSWKSEADTIKELSPKHILFLCVANSARSQMAEGIARKLAPKGTIISSAGSRPSKVNPHSVDVLQEIGIDISSHISKSVDSVDPQGVDIVITLCAEEVCPVFWGSAKLFHWGLPDPTSELDSFRAVRDELLKRLIYLFRK